MDAEPYGQLQLELDGIPMQSAADRATAWLDDPANDPQSRSGIEAQLLLDDLRTRAARAERWEWILSVQEPYASEWGWLIPGGTESPLLYDEAVRAYVSGNYLASFVCSHACCERTLAAHLELQGRLVGGLQRAGLGPLARTAGELGVISQSVLTDLLTVNERRKVTAHLKGPLEPHSISARLVESQSADYGEALEGVLLEDARLGLRVSTRLTRGMQLPQLFEPTQ